MRKRKYSKQNKDVITKKEHKCFLCDKAIPKERADFLLSTFVHEEEMTCIIHSQASKVKGIFNDEVGTSKLIICRHVYSDNVRAKFRDEADHEPDLEVEEESEANK